MQSKDADDGNSRNNRLSNLEQVLQRIDAAAEGGGRICLGEIVQEIRQRSFGLWLLLAGLISLAPLIGDIPGITTLLAVLVFLVAAQMLMRRRYIWLPDWLTHRSVDKGKIEKALASMYGPARTIDRFIRPRLTVLTHETGAQAIALACLAIAVLMPFMEVVPFSANGAGLALAAFGLGVISRDGLLALIAYICTMATFAAVLIVLL